MLKVKQVVNTVEVKTLKSIKKTMQGEKVDPDDDQSGKDQSDLLDQDSSESVLSRSRSSVFRKPRSKSRTRKEQSKTVFQDRITQRTVEQVVKMHAQHDVHTVKMEQSKIIKNTLQRKNPINQEEMSQVRCKAKFIAVETRMGHLPCRYATTDAKKDRLPKW